MNRADVYAAIDVERARQAAKWAAPGYWGRGDCSSPDVRPEVKVMVVGEEFGEVARAVLERDRANLVTELVQLGACCVAWLEELTTAATPAPYDIPLFDMEIPA